MERLFPETDKIKSAVEELHNVKAHKLAYKRYQNLDGESKEFEVS
jgi:hypothetical protein